MTDPIGVLAAARAHALLIGCGTYEAEGWPPVKAAEPTVRDLQSVLRRRCGMAADAVTTLLDPEDPETLLAAVDEAVRKAKGGVFLLYFVGHAASGDNGRLRLMTKRSAPPNSFGPPAHYSQVTFEHVVDVVRWGDPQPRALIAILDCCDANRGARDFDGMESYYLLAAATTDKRALAPPDQEHTAFGGRIIDLLERGTPEFGPTVRLDTFGDTLRRTTPLGMPTPSVSGPAGYLVLAPNPHSEALEQERRSAGSSVIPSGVCPYPGLAAFTEQESEWFYGRGDYADALAFNLTPITTPRLPLILNGPSGSGKSSFIRAGLLPRLADLPPEGAATSRVAAVLEPSTPRPLHGLARHLAELGHGIDIADIESRLRSGEQGVRSVAREVMTSNATPDGPFPELLVIVDQFEKTFDPDTEPGERAAFIAALCTLARTDISPERRPVQGDPDRDNTRVRVLLAVQSEFAALLTDSDDSLRHALAVNQHILPPFNDSDVWQAVVRPAEMEGVSPDDDFVARICADFAAAAQPPYADATSDLTPSRLLPHLAQALRVTWDRSPAGRLTLEAYQSCGRLMGVIQQTADECFRELDESARDVARVLLLSLVNHSGQRPFDLKTIPKETLLDGAAGAVEPPDHDLAARTFETLRKHLLVVDNASGVSLAHLILLTAWPQMIEWVREDREWQIVRERIQDQAARWRAAGSSHRHFTPDIFLPDDFAEAVRRRGRSGLSPSDWEYLKATMAWWTRQARRRRLFEGIHRFSAVVAVLALLAGGAGLAYGRHQRATAQQAQSDHTADRLVSAVNSVWADHPDLAARLAATAYHTAPGPQTWNALLHTAVEVRPTSVSDGLTSHLSGAQVGISDQWIATAGPSGAIAVAALSDGHRVATLPASRGFTTALAFGHSGDLLAGANASGVVRLWNLGAPKAQPRSMVTTALGEVDPDTSFALTFAADDTLLAIGAETSENGGTATKDGTEVWRTDGGPRPARAVTLPGSFARFTGDGTTLAIRDPQGAWTLSSIDSHDEVIRASDGRTAKPPLSRKFPATSVCFSPRGGLFAQVAATTRVWAASGGTTRQTAGLAAHGTSCAFSEDGGMLAIFGTGLELWNLDARHGATRTSVVSAPTGEIHGSRTGQFSPDGRLLAVPGAPPRVWDLTGLRQPGLVAELPVTSVPGPVAIDSSGTIAAVGTRGGGVDLWDIRESRRPKRRPTLAAPAGAGSVTALSFAPGSEHLTATYAGPLRRTWDLTGGIAIPAPTPTTPLDPGVASASGTHGHLTVTSDGPTVTLASGPDGSTVTLTVTPEPGANVSALALNQDDTVLAVGNDQGGVTLIQLDGHSAPATAIDLPSRAARITGIAFGPGDKLLVAAEDGTALLSDLTPASLIDRVCAAPLTPQVAALWPHYAHGSAESACHKT
ncbi:hypothetical protein ACQF4J_47120 (plasmid) [Streptomyces sp. C1-1]|uniref:nSTAND1 domain-containing NTPase n=1 Tax=Streptomyces sp. C1-1 TaxID=3231173 RepID=UPI003D00B55B